MDLKVQHQFYCSPWNLTLRTLKLFLFLQWGSCPRGLRSSRPDSAKGKGAEEDGETTENLLVSRVGVGMVEGGGSTMALARGRMKPCSGEFELAWRGPIAPLEVGEGERILARGNAGAEVARRRWNRARWRGRQWWSGGERRSRARERWGGYL